MAETILCVHQILFSFSLPEHEGEPYFLPFFSVRFRSVGCRWKRWSSRPSLCEHESAVSLEAACLRSQDLRMEGAWSPESPPKGDYRELITYNLIRL